MFTKEQLAWWRSQGFPNLDSTYDLLAVENNEEVLISTIKLLQGKVVAGQNPIFTLEMRGFISNNKIEVEIGEKVFPVYEGLAGLFSQSAIIAYYSDMSVEIPPLYIQKAFKLSINIVNPISGKNIYSKVIVISANINGIVKITNEEIDIVSKVSFVEYHIYWNNEKEGKIEKLVPKGTDENAVKQIKYIYHDKRGVSHEIGEFTVTTVQNRYGSTYGGKTVDLIDIRKLNNYFSDTVYFRLSINTTRYYMNVLTLGSLIGAMLECSFNDFVFNGFSNEKGESIGGSKSHKNGYNGDFRYLRKDQSGQKLYLDRESETGNPCGWKGLDLERQNRFNDALYKFGWKSMLSQYFNNKTILNHCINDDRKDHYDHLHIQGYKAPNFKKIFL